MNLLAVNTSGFSAAVALGQLPESGSPAAFASDLNRPDDARQKAQQPATGWVERSLSADQATARDLIPTIQELVQSAGLVVSQIDRWGVTTGPGSFTGLRIGVATVKTLAYATGAQVVGINSLAAIAHEAWSTGYWHTGRLATVINAFRRQFFAATFDAKTFPTQVFTADAQTMLIGHDELADWVIAQQASLAGPGIKSLQPSERKKLDGRLIEAEWNETAVGVAELAARVKQPVDDPFSLCPRYFRGSAAEEKLAR